MATVAPNQSQVQISLVAFLRNILPAGVEIVEGQDNRVAEPAAPDFVVFTPIRRERSSTNVDAYVDCAFTASIAATVMSVAAMLLGTIAFPTFLFGVGVTPNTIITGQLSGAPGGIGTYSVSVSQNVASETMADGVANFLQPTELTFQVDVHGPNSADNAQIISTMVRDLYATDFFLTTGYDVVPLYADDPKQVPFLNAEQQFENRWIVEVCLQANQTVPNLPQQFAAALKMAGINLANHQ